MSVSLPRTPGLDIVAQKPETITIEVTREEYEVVLRFRKSRQQDFFGLEQQQHVTEREPTHIDGPSVFAYSADLWIADGQFNAVGGDQHIVSVGSGSYQAEQHPPNSIRASVSRAPANNVSMFSHATGFSIGGGDFSASGGDQHTVEYSSRGIGTSLVTNARDVSPVNAASQVSSMRSINLQTARPAAIISGPNVFANTTGVEISKGTVIEAGALSAVGGNQYFYEKHATQLQGSVSEDL